MTSGILIVVKWIWDNFSKDLRQSSNKKWKEFNSEKAARKYTDKLKNRYGKIQIFGIPSPLKLEDIFVSVNVLSKPSAFRLTPKEQLEKTYLCKASFGDVIEEGKDALSIVQKNQRLFILGKPGAGKTTLLKYTTLKTIEGNLSYIPILIPLKSFSESGKSMLDFMVQEFDICNFPEAGHFIKIILETGKAIVLCDGLDEVNKEGGLEDRIINELINFSEKYDQSKMVITSRIAAIEYVFEGFTYVEMADFTETQVNEFVKKWFSPEKNIADSFLADISKFDNFRFRDLSRNPLLLTMLCMRYNNSQSFSSKRSELYRDFLDVLLKKWDDSRRIKRDDIYKNLSLSTKNQMFAYIAAEAFEKKEYIINEDNLSKKVVSFFKSLSQPNIENDINNAGIPIIKAIEAQHGIFVERAQNFYSFAHLTFQEYYTSLYIIESKGKDKLEHLIQNHFLESDWKEVLLLIAESLENADDFFHIFTSVIDNFSIHNNLCRFLSLVEIEAKKLQMNFESNMLQKRIGAIACFFDLAYDLFETGVVLPRKNSDGKLYNGGFSHEMLKGLTTELGILDTAKTCGIDMRPKEDCGSKNSDNKWAKMLNVDQNIPNSLNLDIAFFKTCSSASMISYPFSFEIFQKYFKRTLKLSKKMGLNNIYDKLIAQTFPGTELSYQDIESWKQFGSELRNVFLNHRSIVDYYFVIEHESVILQYLEAIRLLQDCLKTANVSNREEIEDRLFRPPPQHKTDLTYCPANVFRQNLPFLYLGNKGNA